MLKQGCIGFAPTAPKVNLWVLPLKEFLIGEKLLIGAITISADSNWRSPAHKSDLCRADLAYSLQSAIDPDNGRVPLDIVR